MNKVVLTSPFQKPPHVAVVCAPRGVVSGASLQLKKNITFSSDQEVARLRERWQQELAEAGVAAPTLAQVLG